MAGGCFTPSTPLPGYWGSYWTWSSVFLPSGQWALRTARLFLAPHTRFTDRSSHTQLLCGQWRFRLRSSCWTSKHSFPPSPQAQFQNLYSNQRLRVIHSYSLRGIKVWNHQRNKTPACLWKPYFWLSRVPHVTQSLPWFVTHVPFYWILFLPLC